MPAERALSVSQLNEYVRRSLQMDPMLSRVTVRGEISNLKYHQTGMLFFSLKDEAAALSCIMFAEDAAMLRTMPFEGMRATVTGSVGLYVKSGQYRLTARALQPDGLGVLYERLQQLTEKLSREGLFAQERKQALPDRVDTLGVVTSPTGAVLHDIINVSRRRNPHARILLYPVRVQGAGAAEEIAAGIEALNRIDRVSVIIVARGGGSIEDLWEFNDERVARACAASSVPIISAVGHETDHTLCDLASDMRAPTPSAAAELAMPRLDEQMLRLQQAQAGLRQMMKKRLTASRQQLMLVRASLSAHHPAREMQNRKMRLEQLRTLMNQRMHGMVQAMSAQVSMQKKDLEHLHPRKRFGEVQARFESLCAQFRQGQAELMQKKKQELEQAARDLELLSPYAVLRRGYTIVERGGQPVVRADGLRCGDRITVRFADGKAQAEVSDVQKGTGQ